MDIKKRNINFQKSNRYAAYSILAYAFLSLFIESSAVIVPAICFVFSALHLEKTFKSSKIYINTPIYTAYNYSLPFSLTSLLSFLAYLKYFKEDIIVISPMIFIFICLPLFVFYNKVSTKIIQFPTDISLYGLSNLNYEIFLDFQNKSFKALNGFVEISENNNIVGLDLTLYELSENQIKFEEFIGKPISEATLSELQMAKIYYY
jgi:hypothetical protein